jgi:1-acyl-sn-glycerol-3-phosphate acyltransferase
MKRETLLKLVRFLIFRLTDVSFVGQENIPLQGGVLIATNHLSRIDIPTLFVTPRRSDITALVADKYKSYFFLNWFTSTAGGIFIDRSKADFTAFRDALTVLREGHALGIAPEGTRSETGGLLEGKSGTILIALKANVPIVPVGIFGTESSVKMMLSLRRPKITVRFGQAYRLPPLNRENRDEILQRYTDDLMCRIAALIPEKYHGVYKDHPRLKAILNGDTGI